MSASQKLIPVDLVTDSTEPEVIETFAKLKATGNIHRMVANSPTVFKNFIGMAHALRFTTLLDPLERELAICCVLEQVEAEYELIAHRAFAVVVGATEEQAANVSNPSKPGLYTDRQQAILRFARRLAARPSERSELEDDHLEDYLGNRERIELGLTLASYVGNALCTSLFALPAETGSVMAAVKAASTR